MTGQTTLTTIQIRAAALHLLCWMLFILQELFGTWSLTRKPINLSEIYGYYLLNILSFYCFIWILRDCYGRPLSFYFKRIAVVILTLSLFIILKLSLDLWHGGMIYIKTYWGLDISRCLYFLMLAIFYRVAGFLVFYRKRAAEAESAFLRQQLQPHLLFNTLNFIYSTVEAHSREAGKAVWLLSDLMRFSLEVPAESRRIRVNLEATQVLQLIELNRLRFAGAMFLDVELERFDEDCEMLPLILITLAENVFKHGNLRNPEQPALIHLLQKGRQLIFETSNAYPDEQGFHGTGTGLRNVRLRLDFAYGKRYKLTAEPKGEYFIVRLILPL